ncbi:MAG: hypothetical protein ACM3L6_00345 [Deltaproteobacteria bacterium]
MGAAVSLWGLGVSLSVVSLLAGAACLRSPRRVIAFQQAFYLRINWRMEPVSMAREIRNTRVMGAVLVVLGLAALAVLAG